MEKAKTPFVALSFDKTIIETLRDELACSIAWALRKFNNTTKDQAKSFKPDYLFCNYKKVGRSDELWPGPWRWVMYEIDDLDLAHRWLDKGADLLETMWPGELMGKQFNNGTDDDEDDA